MATLTRSVALGALAAALAVMTPSASPAQGQPFEGYVPSGGPGMGGSVMRPGERTAPRQLPGQDGLPPIADGHELTPQRIEGFNAAVQRSFPMTPDMVRQYRRIFEEQQRALLERPEPAAKIDAGMIALEPGEAPGRILIAPGIVSVIGIYDATGQPWPIEEYVIGNGESFQVVNLGENSNNLALTPLTRVGWTNLAIQLVDEPRPIMLRVEVSDSTAHFRHDVQVMRSGPKAVVNTAVPMRTITEAGSGTLMSFLTRTDIPSAARALPVSGVDAQAWMLGDRLFIRSRHALLSPSWTGSLSGPNQVRVYEMSPSTMLLFSVDGRVIRAAVDLP